MECERMRNRLVRCGVPGSILCVALASFAQNLDSSVSSENRSRGKIADEISDNAERSAFLSLSQTRDPAKMLDAARAFLQQFPESAFLAQALDSAARSSFDEGDYKGGLEYARESLALLPEDPLLLVAVADVQAGQLQDDAAIISARDALVYFDRFARPAAVAEQQWPQVKREQQAIAYFVIGRAELHKSLRESSPERRQSLLSDSVASLKQAHSLKPADQETTYLLGVVQLASGKPMPAASNFAAVYMQGGAYAAKALAALRQAYQSIPSSPPTTFDSFLKDAETERKEETDTPKQTAAESNGASVRQLSDYAGSNACKPCHAGIYQNWAQTGMARMFRPYQSQNVIGDFTRNNEYYTGGDNKYLHGKFTITPGTDRKLFARMVVRDGHHYFDIKQSDGQWHQYPVDYTIGSKWQQAYATKLPNGQIHVFPIQYNVSEGKWINYWRTLDRPGTERSDPYNFERLDDSTSYQANCAVCHTSQLRTIPGAGLGEDSFEFREAGIGCEMCHGPSALHIASMKEGTAYDKGPLDPPVDFRRISNRDFVRICSQCHMQSALRDPGPHGELNYSRSGTFFRQYLNIPFDEFGRKSFYKDGRFGQTTFIVEALERSQCFRKGQVSCGSCHDPHTHDGSTNLTSLKFKDQPDQMCTGCHAQFVDKAKAVEHTHHASNSEGSRCISCHMPPIMDALDFGARTHQIDDIPNAEMTLRFGQQDSPNACLICHTEKSAKWAQSQLLSWKSVAVPGASIAASRVPTGR
jgi:predicted CXXCH cytochrome family protein